MQWWERLVLGAWMVLTLVLMRSYAGTLMSLLAVRQIPQPFQDLRRLLDDPDVTMVWEAGSMYVQFLMVSRRRRFQCSATIHCIIISVT